MKKRFFLFLFAAFAGTMAMASSPFFTKADAFFKKNVTYGKVDYAGIKANPAELNELVGMVGKFNLAAESNGGQKAFWLNGYNILVIKNVVDHYPIAKPTDVSGFFDGIKFTIAGQSLTLSDIENKKIRPTYKDARVHFALVCAAKSCPPLASYAFMPDKVDRQLEDITRKAMNNKSFLKVSDDNKTVQFSKIMEWYQEDFLAEAGSVLEYVNKYRSTPVPASYKQSSYTYNWSLNEKK